MADNYLEKKMEEHRRGVQPRPKHYSYTGQTPGKLTISFTRQPVFIIYDGAELTQCAVESFAAAGCPVAFTGTNRNSGKELAQRTGSRFCPSESLDFSEIVRHFNLFSEAKGAVAVVVCDEIYHDIARRLITHAAYSAYLVLICDKDRDIEKLNHIEGINTLSIRKGADLKAVKSLLPLLLTDCGPLLDGHLL